MHPYKSNDLLPIAAGPLYHPEQLEIPLKVVVAVSGNLRRGLDPII
jgi:hypothetical protein